MIILNLTQHRATPEQIAQGVADLPEAQRQELHNLLTFEEAPSCGEVWRRALAIARLCDTVIPDEGTDTFRAMIGGAPFLLTVLEQVLHEECGLGSCFSFSKRVSAEITGANGEVVKTSAFKHVGFVDAYV